MHGQQNIKTSSSYDDLDSGFLRIVGKSLPDYTALYRKDSIYSLHLQNVCYFTCLGIIFKPHSDTLNCKATRAR